MVWKVKSIIHRTTPAREREQTCATEAEFERAVKSMHAGLDAAHLGYPS